MDDNAAASISFIAFSSCTAETIAGAILASGHSTPNIFNCTIKHCTAGSFGSGIVGNDFSTPSFSDLLVRYATHSYTHKITNVVIIIHPTKAEDFTSVIVPTLLFCG